MLLQIYGMLSWRRYDDSKRQQIATVECRYRKMNLPVFEEPGMLLATGRRKAFNEFNAMVYSGAVKIEPVDECYCGARNFHLLSIYDRFGLPFGTKICKSCGLITQTLRIHPDSLSEFYEKIYWPLVAGEGCYSTATKKDETFSYIIKHIPTEWQDLRVFEVGCGSGGRISRLRDELERIGHTVTAVGCDYSSWALRHVIQKDIQTIQGGMDDLLVAGKADILILSHVFEHFPDLAQAMEQIDKLVHYDSLIYIEVPGVVDLENKPEYLYNYQKYCVLAHTYNFSLSSLVQVMSSCGFTLVQGDEYVRSVFKKGQSHNHEVSAYEEIMAALERAHTKHMALQARRNHPIGKYLRNVAKALKGRAS